MKKDDEMALLAAPLGAAGVTSSAYAVTDNVEVVQAQEYLTSAELDVINSVFAHNVAGLRPSARSIASAADGLTNS